MKEVIPQALGGIASIQAQSIFDFRQQMMMKHMRPRINSNEQVINTSHALMTTSLPSQDVSDLTEEDLYATLMT